MKPIDLPLLHRNSVSRLDIIPEKRVGHRPGSRDITDLPYPFGAIWSQRIFDFHHFNHDVRHIFYPGNYQFTVTFGFQLTILHGKFLAERIAEPHDHRPFDLAFKQGRVDNSSTVMGRHHTIHPSRIIQYDQMGGIAVLIMGEDITRLPQPGRPIASPAAGVHLAAQFRQVFRF